MRIKSSLLLHYLFSAFAIFLIIFILIFYSANKFKQFYIEQLEHTLFSYNQFIAQQLDRQTITRQQCLLLEKLNENTRVTIINNDGTVLCDNKADSDTMENHKKKPEVAKALLGFNTPQIRFSNTVHNNLLYAASPWHMNDSTIGVIRTALPIINIENEVAELYQLFYLLITFMLVGIGLAIIYSYQKVNKPLAQISLLAKKLSKGSLTEEIPTYDIKEINQLGLALNNTFKQLAHLENMRQEFVGNVSHELKTPIATIRSYVETLLDGAALEPKDLKRFLQIIHKQNNRLANIVDDLLMLSRLEASPITNTLEFDAKSLNEILNEAISHCYERAEHKHIDIELHKSTTHYIHVDQSLMLQAFINLLDNAIKYSPENTQIDISVKSTDEFITINIDDQGPGIEPIHRPRLFERFYRVDKSRSRKEGGTGLGLAIVKHIILIHQGSISVESSPSGGSRFIVKLSLVN